MSTAGTMQIGSLTAMLSYIMQILMAVMMASFMLDDGAARGGLRRSDRRGARDRVLGSFRRERRSLQARPGTGRLTRVAVLATPAPRSRCCAGSRFKVEPGTTTADHRLDRSGQDHAAQPDPAPDRRRPTARSMSAVSTSPPRPRLLRRAIGFVPQKAVPVLRHHRDQPALRQARRHRRRALARRSRSRRPPTS